MGVVDRPITHLPHTPIHRTQAIPDSVLRVDNKSGEVQTETYSGVLVHGLQIPSSFSPCKTHSREMAQTSGFDPTSQVKTCFDCKMFDVAYWVPCLNGENGPGGMPSHEVLQFHLKEHWRYPQSLDSLLPWTETISAHLECWQIPQRDERCSPSSQRPQYLTLYRCLKQGWGAHLEQASAKGLWSDREKGYT